MVCGHWMVVGLHDTGPWASDRTGQTRVVDRRKVKRRKVKRRKVKQRELLRQKTLSPCSVVIVFRCLCQPSDALRRDMWPEPKPLRDTLSGKLEELKRTADS